MEDIELPDLPTPNMVSNVTCLEYFGDDQMRKYATSAILADREKRAQAAQGWKLIGWTCGDADCGRIHDTRPDDDEGYMQAVYVMQSAPTEASKPVQAEAPPSNTTMKRDEWGALSPEAQKVMREAVRARTLRAAQGAQSIRDVSLGQAEAPTASNAEREENPIETMERLGFMFALDEETREQADKLASALRGSRVNYQIEQAAADMLWKLSSALATQPTASNAERELLQRNLGNLANNTADVLEQCAEALFIMRAEGVVVPLTPLTDEQLRACFHDAWSNDYRLVDQRYLYQLLMAAHGTQTLKADSGTGPFESLRQSANGDSARGTEIRWLGDDSLSYDVRRTGESRDS